MAKSNTGTTTRREGNNKFLKDKYITTLFRDKDLEEWSTAVIKGLIRTKYKDFDGDFEIIDIRMVPAEDVKLLEADFLAESDDFIVSLEFNYLRKAGYTDNKNLSYVCALILRQVGPGKNKKYKLKPIIQICLDGYDRFNKGEFTYWSVLMEEKYHIPRENAFAILDVNLDFLNSLNYNKLSDLEKEDVRRLIYFFVNNDKSFLEKVYIGDLLMEKVRKKLEVLESSIDDYLYYDRDELWNQELYESGQEDGYEKGREELITTMFNNGVGIDDISKYTNIPIEEVKEILNKSE